VSEAPRPGSPGYPVMPQVPSPPDREEFGGAADVSGVSAGGREAVTVRITGVEHDTVVAFLSSGCLTCQRFWDAFRKPRKLGLPAGTRLVVVTKGPDDESVSAVASVAPGAVPTVMSSEAWHDYDVPGSPYFVYVHGPTGRVRGEGTGPDWDQRGGQAQRRCRARGSGRSRVARRRDPARRPVALRWPRPDRPCRRVDHG
jgi:hypothetical protein